MFSERFSHIYVEEKAWEYEATQAILKRLPEAQVIKIRHYKDVFNRPNQSLLFQKEARKLILALKTPPFIYPGSGLIQDFGFEQYLYAPIMMNCLYDCDYCILQGMYQSGNVVFFVNSDEYLAEAAGLGDGIPKHLSISYDTDLLAFEGIYPITRKWIETMVNYPEVMMEIRTKSANYRILDDLDVRENVIFSWTLSPDCIVEKYEHHTVSLAKRLQSAKAAQDKGWKVRICIDPVVDLPEYEKVYAEFLEEVFSILEPTKINDVALGVFRLSSNHLKNIRRKGVMSDILYFPYAVDEGVATYEPERKNALLTFMFEALEKFIPEDRIYAV